MATSGEASTHVYGAADEANDGWTLPDWEAYSEASGSSFRGDWSDVEADVSLDTASSVASTEHQRVYHLQRRQQRTARPRDLKDIHTLYTRRRQDAAASPALSSVDTSRSAAWFRPTPCSSPSQPEKSPLSPITAPTERREDSTAAQKELLAQQSEISAELQAVRRQLSEFQDKWKQSVAHADEKGGGAKCESEAPTAASSWSASPNGESRAVQTDVDGQEEAVKHWTLLLTHKLDALAVRYSHAPSQAFHAATTHLSGVQDCTSHADASEAGTTSSWHVGHALKTLVSLETAERFLELERSLATLHTAIEAHERRQLSLFDASVRQVQRYHHEKLQRVVDESLVELKLVRGRYKKKETQLEQELRVAHKDAGEWKQRVAQLELEKTLLQDAKDAQMQQEAQRFADELERLRGQLRAAKAESLNAGTLDEDSESVVRQAKQEASRLEAQYQGLKAQTQYVKEQHDRELRVLQSMIQELREEKQAAEAQLVTERQSFVTALEDMRAQRTPEIQAKNTAQGDVAAASTQTEEDAEGGSADPSRTQVSELNRRCLALEKLLADAKPEQKPFEPVEPEPSHSVRDLGSSRSSSVMSDSSTRRSAPTSKNKALARALLSDTTLATDEATLGATDWWDSASLTSMDSLDGLASLASMASQRTTPRRHVATSCRRDASALLALAHKLQLKSGGDGEPDPEIRGEMHLHPKQKHAVASQAQAAKVRQSRDESDPNGRRPVRPGASVFDDLLGG